MDSFSLLSYWRAALSARPAINPDLIAAEDDEDEDDDASFFDLEFSQADADADADAEVEDEDDDDESAFGFDLASDASSPPHDLFLKPSSTIVFETDSKPTQFPASILKSATKLRVLMLAFKKAKPSGGTAAATSAPSSPKLGKYFIKFKVEEVPIVSFFTRDNSAKTKPEVTATADGDEKKLSKDVVLKYLNKIKPLYMRVSRRYLEKLIGERSSSSENPPAPLANVDKDSNGVIPTGLRVVRKKLRKSRSASSATEPPSPPRRRDDSLIEQQDGIQNAIAHCKRSFNKESQSRSQGSESPLIRSLSDPGEC